MLVVVRPGRFDSAQWVTVVAGRTERMFVRKIRLCVRVGPNKGFERDFDVPQVRVGGRKIADFVLSDPKVSGLHFEISLDKRGYRITDLQSTNGTHVDGLRIVEAYLPAGAMIRAGNSELCFEPLEESFEIALAKEDRCVGMVGRSAAMRALFAGVRRLAAMDATVLITGETGTGKELVAEAMHELSPRATGPFVVVDCGAIAPTLIESELFGHERGAFTGATSQHAGAFERAHEGSLFLDEIGELPLDLQPRLLRAIERKEIRRLGGTQSLKTNVRIVAATHRDLGLEVSRGRFREDLFYRLAVAHVHVPPLRERIEDIPLLVPHFLDLMKCEEKVIGPETMVLLARHDWPGNVRELRNVLERASAQGTVGPDAGELWVTVRPPAAPSGLRDEGADSVDLNVSYRAAKQQVISEFERRYIGALLKHHGGNVSQAARAAGVDRMTIHKILSRLERSTDR